MKHILFFLILFCSVATVSAQNDYYLKQAQSYQREAEYYIKQAQGYEREVEYYNQKAQGYLREAEYGVINSMPKMLRIVPSPINGKQRMQEKMHNLT